MPFQSKAQHNPAYCRRYISRQVLSWGTPASRLRRHHINELENSLGITSGQDIRATLDSFRPLCYIPNCDVWNPQDATFFLYRSAVGQNAESRPLETNKVTKSQWLDKTNARAVKIGLKFLHSAAGSRMQGYDNWIVILIAD